MNEPAWIRVAGHTPRIKEEGNPFHWRCYLGDDGPEVPLRDMHVIGQVTPKNMRLGTDPSRTNPEGLLAWFDLYGTLVVEDGVALVRLAEAPEEDTGK